MTVTTTRPSSEEPLAARMKFTVAESEDSLRLHLSRRDDAAEAAHDGHGHHGRPIAPHGGGRVSAAVPAPREGDHAGWGRVLTSSHHRNVDEKGDRGGGDDDGKATTKPAANPTLEEEEEENVRDADEERRERDRARQADDEKKRKKHEQDIIERPGIHSNTVHGMMIDAGSTGSRMHVYEFAPRILEREDDLDLAVSGMKLTYPGTESRWTDRLQPGLNTFATIEDDDELEAAIAEYLRPLVQFARDVLHSKQVMWGLFPIYLKATGGMRALPAEDRLRLMSTVRSLFNNSTFSPFLFEDEHARVISGEEESIYGWTCVNFLMGTLLENTEGSGTVVNPQLTYGAMDLGGASTQISFYEPNGDIMSNLFKLQIGAAKHWNVYAHSFLQFGINSAHDRMNARLYFQSDAEERSRNRGVLNPCLPGGYVTNFTSNIHILKHGGETVPGRGVPSTGDPDDGGDTRGMYHTLVRNDGGGGDFDRCSSLARVLLRKEVNSWCDFAHEGDCSFAGVYQPPLPIQSTNFGEFLGFSNFHHVWQFLRMEPRSNLRTLRDRAEEICSMSWTELRRYNDGASRAKDRVDDEHLLAQYCFRSSYVFELLHEGYGFGMDEFITATHVVGGHKVSWALGSMLYEINTLPWRIEAHLKPQESSKSWKLEFASTLVIFLSVLLCCSYYRFYRGALGRDGRREEYVKIAEDGDEVGNQNDDYGSATGQGIAMVKE